MRNLGDRNVVVRVAVPTSSPRPTDISSDCRFASVSGPRNLGGWVWVDPDPVGAVEVWLPGWNAKQCTATLTHIDATQASAIATAIRQAPREPRDNGESAGGSYSQARLAIYLQYPGHTEAELAVVDAAGDVSAPGLQPRALSYESLPLDSPAGFWIS